MTAAVFPVIMLLAYIGLVLYYKSTGNTGPTSLLDEGDEDASAEETASYPGEDASAEETEDAAEVAEEETPSDESKPEAEEGGEE